MEIIGLLVWERLARLLIKVRESSQRKVRETGDRKERGIIFKARTEREEVDGQTWETPPFSFPLIARVFYSLRSHCHAVKTTLGEDVDQSHTHTHTVALLSFFIDF